MTRKPTKFDKIRQMFYYEYKRADFM